MIQDRIQSSLDSSLPEGCSKCCLMMKRMKEGIMKYRVFLEEEANAAELSYNTLKAQFS